MSLDFLQVYSALYQHYGNNYLCGGVNHKEDAVLLVIYAPAEVIIFLSADIPRNGLGASLRWL